MEDPFVVIRHHPESMMSHGFAQAKVVVPNANFNDVPSKNHSPPPDGSSVNIIAEFDNWHGMPELAKTMETMKYPMVVIK